MYLNEANKLNKQGRAIIKYVEIHGAKILLTLKT